MCMCAVPVPPNLHYLRHPNTIKLPMPPGNIAITGFTADVVDENGTAVPLSEVYNHHWLVYNNRGNSGMCQVRGRGGERGAT